MTALRAKLYDPAEGLPGKKPEKPMRSFRDLLEEGNCEWPEARMGEYGLDISRVTFRDLTTAGTGGFIVGSKSPINAIEYAGSILVTAKAGVQVIPVTDFGPVPKVSSVAVAGWIGEGQGVTEPNITFASISTSPKTVAAFADVSRVLNVQTSPVAGDVVAKELLGACARAVDTAVLHGSGSSGQPHGIDTHTGVDSRSGAAFAVGTATAMLKAVKDGNAIPTAWIMASDAADLLRRRALNGTGSGYLIGADGKMLNLPVLVSSGVTAGTVFLGAWSECIVAVRSIEVLRNPFTQGKSGFVEVGVYWVGDMLLRHPAAFAVATGTT